MQGSAQLGYSWVKPSAAAEAEHHIHRSTQALHLFTRSTTGLGVLQAGCADHIIKLTHYPAGGPGGGGGSWAGVAVGQPEGSLDGDAYENKFTVPFPRAVWATNQQPEYTK